MSRESIFFLILSLLCVVFQGFFSMFEMASVSFNKARLTFYTSKKMKKAIWLEYLLQRPSRLFGTTLILVSTFLQLGSEASRRFYESIGLSPDIAPLSQVLLIVVFGELSPLFAARRYPERIAMFNVPLVYFLSKMLFPFTYIIDKISSFANFIFGNEKSVQLFLTKEEIQKAFEEKESITKDTYINKTVGNIFSLKNVTAKKIMMPLSSTILVPSDFTIAQVKDNLKKSLSSFVLIYHHNINNIISIVPVRDLLRAKLPDPIKNYGLSPWFITENLSLIDILKQFRRNNQMVSIILDLSGTPIGIITFDMVIYQIFGSVSPKIDLTHLPKEEKKQIFIEKTLPGDMLVKDFNKKFFAALPETEETLSDLINKSLQHHPSEGEIAYIGNFEFIVKEVTFLGSKTVLVRNLK